ncbi:MAG: hypothetical protein ABW275_00470, partial [Hansschlegelia sp.]
KGITFSQFSTNVYVGNDIPLQAVGVPQPYSIGSLKGAIAEFAAGPDRRGVRGSLLFFYVDDGCLGLSGVVQAWPTQDSVFEKLKAVADEFDVAEVEVGSTSREITLPSREITGVDSPALNVRPQVEKRRIDPITLDDIRQVLHFK